VAGTGRNETVFDETTERGWPDPELGPYRLTLYWSRRNGRPEVVGVQLLPGDLESAKTIVLKTSTIRELKIAEIAAEERERLEFMPPKPPTPQAMVESMRPATVRRLQRAADIYQDAWRTGHAPTQAVSKTMNVSLAAAVNMVRRARLAGFLPPTSAGIPQG
jgi:hypothetical protein